MIKVYITVKLPNEQFEWYYKVGTMIENEADMTNQAKLLRKDALGNTRYQNYKDNPSALAWAVYLKSDDAEPVKASKNWK